MIASAVASLLAVLAGPAPQAPAYKFVGGRWFNGRAFERTVFYAVDGVLSRTGPAQASVVDLQGGFVVPPFADAHNHYIAGPRDIDRILGEYLRDGIFYAKNPASIRRDTQQIADRINRRDSVDVVFANAGITASGGHPVRLYEETLRKVKTPGPDGTFADLGYTIIDTREDLERKWRTVFVSRLDGQYRCERAVRTVTHDCEVLRVTAELLGVGGRPAEHGGSVVHCGGKRVRRCEPIVDGDDQRGNRVGQAAQDGVVHLEATHDEHTTVEEDDDRER